MTPTGTDLPAAPDDLSDGRYHGDAPPADAAGTTDDLLEPEGTGDTPEKPWLAPEQERGTGYVVFRARHYVADEAGGGWLRRAVANEAASEVLYDVVGTEYARSAKDAIRAVRKAERVPDGDAQYHAAPVRNWTGLGFHRKETVVEEEVEL